MHDKWKSESPSHKFHILIFLLVHGVDVQVPSTLHLNFDVHSMAAKLILDSMNSQINLYSTQYDIHVNGYNRREVAN